MEYRAPGADVRRRDFLKAGLLGLCGSRLCGSPHRVEAAVTPAGALPEEPLAIGREPQFLFDLHVVDMTWPLREKQEPVRRVFHPPKKHAAGPLWSGGHPGNLSVVRDAEGGLFRMWYQANVPIKKAAAGDGQPNYQALVSYAQSRDGIHWERPALDLFPWFDVTPNNVVLGRAEYRDRFQSSGPNIVELPETDRRGFRYVLSYRAKGPVEREHRGIRVVGSHDGVHWDLANDTCIAELHSDTHNAIMHDPQLGEYVLYCRAKDIYPTGGRDRLNAGQSRRGVARMASPTLWGRWASRPRTILVPDEIDAESGYNFFYGMPAVHRAGVYWGFLQPFLWNDFIHTELVWSRDGIHFQRMPSRPKLIEYGPDGSWDDNMIFVGPSWVEVGDEWWLYYSGWDGPHGTTERTGAVGLATVRKEGFISLRGPRTGGVVCTRALRWPGGTLRINADARAGELTARVCDEFRRPLDGFDYADCRPFSGDSVSHEVAWNDRSADALKDRIVRLEFLLQDADLYAFRAADDPA
jgi:hypothetical protein